MVAVRKDRAGWIAASRPSTPRRDPFPVNTGFAGYVKEQMPVLRSFSGGGSKNTCPPLPWRRRNPQIRNRPLPIGDRRSAIGDSDARHQVGAFRASHCEASPTIAHSVYFVNNKNTVFT